LSGKARGSTAYGDTHATENAAGGPPTAGLPVGVQVMAPALADDRCYRVAAALEAGRAPILNAAPEL
jgi:Asp-tRNA(Asn)/Glu-tRNA(Gln) amidotransferase A subunit family amidase